MSLCTSIDTLAMAYLDDELAAEEQRELELHIRECASCKSHVDAERADHELLRGALAAPAAPDLLRARVASALDAEDRVQRRRWTQHLLPGSAMLAGAAAIAVFVGVRPPGQHDVGSVAKEAARVQAHASPLEVQGASTGPWMRAHFEPGMALPHFGEPDVQLIGGRLTAVNGHDAALVLYQVNLDGNPFGVWTEILRDVRDDELADGNEVRVGDRTMHIVELNGKTMVTYVDAHHLGYVFMAPELSENDLVGLVSRIDLDSLR